MSYIAEIEVDHPDHNLNPTLDTVPDLDIRVESQPASISDPPTLFYLLDAPEFAAVETALDADHTVDEWRLVAEIAPQRIYKITYTAEAIFLTPTFTDLGLRILDSTGGDGRWQFRLHVPDRDKLARFQSRCRTEGIQCELQKLYRMDDENAFASDAGVALTDRQREVARTATAMGYFDSDGASADEVAAELDITASTLSSHLRTVTEKLFVHRFGSGD